MSEALNILLEDREARRSGDLSKLDFSYKDNLRLDSFFDCDFCHFFKENKGMLIAGGSINGIVSKRIKSLNDLDGDIDIFFHEITIEEATDLIIKFERSFKHKFFKVYRTSASYTYEVIYPANPKIIKYQFITALYPSAKSVILSFDISCCAIGIVSNQKNLDVELIATPACKYSLKTKRNIYDPLRGSYNTLQRFIKYNRRGYKMEFPELVARPGIEDKQFQVTSREYICFNVDNTLNYAGENCYHQYSAEEMRYVLYENPDEINLYSIAFLNLSKLVHQDLNLACFIEGQSFYDLQRNEDIKIWKEHFYKISLKDLKFSTIHKYFKDVKEKMLQNIVEMNQEKIEEARDEQWKIIEERYEDYIKLYNTDWITYNVGTYGSIFGRMPIDPEKFYGDYYYLKN
jgi:hypothetical protein